MCNELFSVRVRVAESASSSLALWRRVEVVRQDASAMSIAESLERERNFMEHSFEVEPGLFVDALDTEFDIYTTIHVFPQLVWIHGRELASAADSIPFLDVARGMTVKLQAQPHGSSARNSRKVADLWVNLSWLETNT